MFFAKVHIHCPNIQKSLKGFTNLCQLGHVPKKTHQVPFMSGRQEVWQTGSLADRKCCRLAGVTSELRS